MKSPMMSAALSSLLLTMLLLSPGYSADEKAKADKGKETKEVKKEAASEENTPKAFRLPNHFGKLGLSEPQRDAVLKAQSKYGEKIAELQKQIEKLKDEQREEIREILNRDQKAELDKLTAEQAKSKAAADKLAADNEADAKTKKVSKKKSAEQEAKLKEKKDKSDKDDAKKEEKKEEKK